MVNMQLSQRNRWRCCHSPTFLVNVEKCGIDSLSLFTRKKNDIIGRECRVWRLLAPKRVPGTLSSPELRVKQKPLLLIGFWERRASCSRKQQSTKILKATLYSREKQLFIVLEKRKTSACTVAAGCSMIACRSNTVASLNWKTPLRGVRERLGKALVNTGKILLKDAPYKVST